MRRERLRASSFFAVRVAETMTGRRSALDATPEEQKTFDQGHASMRQGWTETCEPREEYLAAR